MPNQIADQTRMLRSRIAQVEQALAIQHKLCQRDPRSFTYKLSFQSLAVQRDRMLSQLGDLLRERQVEELDISIDGPVVSEGTAPLATLGFYFSRLQQTVNSIAQALHSGPTIRGPIASHLIASSMLRLKAISEGSFCMTLVGYTQPTLFGESLLARSLDSLTLLVAAEDDTPEVLAFAGQLGARTMSHYRSLISGLAGSGVTVKIAWSDLEGKDRRWSADPQKLKQMSRTLHSIDATQSEHVVKGGSIVGASLLSDRFEFVVRGSDEIITGRMTSEAKTSVRALFGKEVRAELEAKVTADKITGQTRTTWTLLQLTDLDELA